MRKVTSVDEEIETADGERGTIRCGATNYNACDREEESMLYLQSTNSGEALSYDVTSLACSVAEYAANDALTFCSQL
ncbi:hypothetical protein OSTOST_23152 [Ostertagia ostertagi]